MDNVILNKAKEKAIIYKSISREKASYSKSIESLELSRMNYENRKKMLLQKKVKIEDMLKDILNNSKENVKSTVPIINNINKQLMQDNLLLKIKIESMKQSYKNIVNYCTSLKDIGINDKHSKVIDDIIQRLKCEVEEIRER